jgi:hypothetical protein
MSEPTQPAAPTPTDPMFEKVKALLDPIVATLPTVGSQKPFEPFRFRWLNRAHTSFIAESGKTMQDLDCPGAFVIFADDMYPSADRGEIFVHPYTWAGGEYKWLAERMVEACARAGLRARVTKRKKALVVAIAVDVEKWYARE